MLYGSRLLVVFNQGFRQAAMITYCLLLHFTICKQNLSNLCSVGPLVQFIPSVCLPVHLFQSCLGYNDFLLAMIQMIFHTIVGRVLNDPWFHFLLYQDVYIDKLHQNDLLSVGRSVCPIVTL